MLLVTGPRKAKTRVGHHAVKTAYHSGGLSCCVN